MGIASLVLGIVSLVVAWIPCVGSVAFLPALVGLILGIIDVVKKSKAKAPKGIGLAGTICSGIALLFIGIYFCLFYYLLSTVSASSDVSAELSAIGY